MTKDEALDLALEALEKSLPRLAPYGEQDWLDSKAAITAIKQARSAPVQEPVAWVREHELPLAPGDAFSWVETFVHKTPLYTTPPAAQRQWVTFPTMLRKMWSGSEVQAWLDENVNKELK